MKEVTRAALLAAMRLALECVGLSMLAAWFVPVSAAEERTDTPASSMVVLIGVADYGDLGQLTGPAYDICALYALYRNLLRIPAQNISVYFTAEASEKSVPCQTSGWRGASRRELVDGLRISRERLRKATMIYMHFAGHGFERERRQYLLLAQGNAGGGDDEPALPLDELLALLPARPRPFDGLAVFVDACRNSFGAAGRQKGERLSSLAKAAASQSVRGATGALFLSASPGEYSYTRRSISGARESQLMGYHMGRNQGHCWRRSRRGRKHHNSFAGKVPANGSAQC